MICTEAEARAVLGLLSSITDEERAVLTLLLPAVQNRIVKHIGYDPEQRSATEYYPRADPAGGYTRVDVGWGVDSSHRRAEMYYRGGGAPQYPTLQLARLPVREITDLRIDYDGKFGRGTNSFATASQKTRGTDYWEEFDESNVCMSGCVFGSSAWPTEPGTVRVTYRAGYSPDELAGRAETDATAADGTITTARLDGSGIKRAFLVQITKAMQTWANLKKSARVGYVPGAKQSETLGSYSYSLGGSGGADIAGLTVALCGEAIDELEPYVHWGQMRL